jgi:hypothetical protein
VRIFPNKSGINLVKATEGTFTQSIRVDGGDEGKAISEFTGPVVFSNKVTSTASRGIEATLLFLQGDSTVSRKVYGWNCYSYHSRNSW